MKKLKRFLFFVAGTGLLVACSKSDWGFWEVQDVLQGHQALL
jgi:hypothetical protein